VLIGIEREGNKGYLVRGGILPPKVNVINYTQAISFREMMKRLQRVDWKGKGIGKGRGQAVNERFPRSLR
jgi:hypothetical protein